MFEWTTWQDVVIGAGQFSFAVALLPSIRSRAKPAPFTSLLTAIGLTIFGFTYLTLGLWLAVAGSWTTAALWWVLVYQVRR